MMRALFPLLLAMATLPALADDVEALKLADSAPASVTHASDWHAYAEGALGRATRRNGVRSEHTQRLSFDFSLDKALAPGWRAVFADRLDASWQGKLSERDSVNTLKEAYLSWQAAPDRLIDGGRINARYGAATGYNPTDWFRDGANRSVTSLDPVSLKKNRLGSAMLRGQALWNGGSLTAIYSPKLEERPSDAPFNADWGATNNRDRWLLAASRQLGDGISPQWLLYDDGHGSPQLGFNLSLLPNDATVVYLEWSGGRTPSQLSQALGAPDDSTFRSRLASGLTWTSANKITLTLEYEYDGAALDAAGWQALQRGPLRRYGQYRAWVQNAQELPTREALFFHATWQDALLNHLDLSAILRINRADRSRLSWLETRYHFARTDLALQWQLDSGSAASEYGAAPQARAVQAVLREFF